MKRVDRLPPLIQGAMPVASRMDSVFHGTGVFWNVDGRPWELSAQDIRNWKAITERGWWTEGWNAVAPIAWTSIPEFEAEIKRKARSYRDRLLLVEGAPNPSDVFKRRRERTRAARQADAAELVTTIDNATAIAGIAKLPLKVGVKAVMRTARGRAAHASAGGALSKTVSKTRSAIATPGGRTGKSGATVIEPSPGRSSLGPVIDSVPNSNPLKRPMELDHVPRAIDNATLTRPTPTTTGQTSTPVPGIDSWKLRHGDITKRLNDHLSHSLKQAELTPAQIEDAVANGRGSLHWGTQIDTKFKNLVQNDYLLRGEVVVSPRRLPKDAVAPDVIDLQSKRWWDVTSTANEFAKKSPKYGPQYGDGTPLLYHPQ